MWLICDDLDGWLAQDSDGDCTGASDVTGAVGNGRWVGQFEVWELVHPHFYCDLHFQAGQIGT